jgi:hypothetical protein
MARPISGMATTPKIATNIQQKWRHVTMKILVVVMINSITN